MEHETKSCKCIAIDYNVAQFIDFNGWPKEVRILSVKGLEKVFDTTCLLFDPVNSLSFEYVVKIFDKQHMYHEEV